MNKKKAIPIGLSTLIVFPILTGCSNQAAQVDEKQSDGETPSETIGEVQETYLAVDPDKCIGCGKCINVDPAHFLMDTDTRKSTVISQSDLGSSTLANAIDRCPTDAITL